MHVSIGKIKRVCETKLGLVSQCCLPKNVKTDTNIKYLENIALKINVKVHMYRYFATHFSMYCTAGIYNSILN